MRPSYCALWFALLIVGCSDSITGPDIQNLILYNGKNEPGHWSIFSIRPDGSERKEVVPNAHLCCVSGNHRMMVLQHTTPHVSTYVAAVDGSGMILQRAPSGRDIEGDVALSFDGTTIAYFSDSTIYVASTDGSNARAVVEHVTTTVGGLKFSPDTRRLVYSTSAAKLHIVSVDGSTHITVAMGKAGSKFRYAGTPQWSPSGDRIVYVGALADDNLNGTLMVVNADGSNPRVIASGFEPQWSPDGERIAFSMDVNADTSLIATVNADGTGLERRTDPTTSSCIFPCWSPDGWSLAYLLHTDRAYHLETISKYAQSVYTVKKQRLANSVATFVWI